VRRGGLAVTLITSIALAASVAASPPTGEKAADTSETDGEAAEGSTPAGVAPADLPAAIDGLLADPAFAKAKISIDVVDLETGERLFERNGDLAVNPASNAKLLTTAAALARLGPDHRFATTVVADDVDDGVVHDLWLVGGGDPTLTTGDLWELATELHARGIRRVRGKVYVDIGRFDREGWPPGFTQKDEIASYRVPTSALAIDDNTFEVTIRPAAAGSAPKAVVSPPVPSITVSNEASTVAGTRNRLIAVVTPSDEDTKVALSGTLGADSEPSAYRYPLHRPSQHAGETFVVLLEKAGVKVDGERVASKPAPTKHKVLATHRSDPLSVIVRAINKQSNNFMAEQLAHSLAQTRGATAEAGLEAIRATIGELGVPVEGLIIGNGSGLYDNNRVSAKQLTALLGAAWRDFRIAPDFVASLSIVGVDGTGKRWLTASPSRGWIRVKTGTLDGITALSGYAGAAGRKPVAFAIVFNDLPRWSAGKAKRAQYQIAEAVALHVAAKAPAAQP
jgi:D-alanyl-D-alanine carboxypeptidase/D-alanyl-D-alanine-endopeptidase (penicillin-binding protein 4)